MNGYVLSLLVVLEYKVTMLSTHISAVIVCHGASRLWQLMSLSWAGKGWSPRFGFGVYLWSACELSSTSISIIGNDMAFSKFNLTTICEADWAWNSNDILGLR